MSMITVDERTLLDVSEVKNLLKASKTTIYNYMNTRDFPRPYKFKNKTWWDEAFVKRWIASQYEQR